jgi:gamma-glutamyltranspeptidase / glutathione hydrolase
MIREIRHIPFDFNSRRSPILGIKGMVATSQPLAVAAGLQVLAAGGNAADAAVAAAAALNVTEPTSTGIGGDCFALFYDAKSTKISALNGSGRAPEDLTLERVRRDGYSNELPPLHPYTITVPGACAGWCDLVEKHGRLEMSEVLQPAIRLAEKGFPVAPITAYFWERGVARQLSRALGGQELTIDRKAPRAGEIFRNPGLARTLRIVANGGKVAFYQGEIAEAVAAAVQAAGGVLAVSDMVDHQSTWEQPISVNYRGFRVWECPPNAQGLAALLALNILEGFEAHQGSSLSAEWLHLEIEAMRLAFADTRWYVADPQFSPIPVDALLSKSYARERGRLINHHKATLDQLKGVPHSFSDTVYLTVIDGEGNACSFINSNYMGFGTGIVPPGYGFTLQNRGHNFNLQPEHPNVLAPGKRPYHTIIPSMVTREADDSLFASFGVMGGFMQPQGHVQVISALVDSGLDPQSALDRPRFCIADGTQGGVVMLEEGMPEGAIKVLDDLGHPLKVVNGMERSVFGRGQIILRNAESGVLWGASDARADGCAMCL